MPISADQPPNNGSGIDEAVATAGGEAAAAVGATATAGSAGAPIVIHAPKVRYATSGQTIFAPVKR